MYCSFVLTVTVNSKIMTPIKESAVYVDHYKEMLGIFSNIPISFIECTMLKAHIDQPYSYDIKLTNRYNIIKPPSTMKNNSFNDVSAGNVSQEMLADCWEI